MPEQSPIADAIVVAAGSSSRMGGIDKLTAPIAGRPVLAWTLDAFVQSDAVDRIVLVAAPGRVESLRAERWLPASVFIVAGGERRQDSVAAGVAELERLGLDDARVVLIHDGARPAVGGPLIARLAAAAAEHGAAIPVLPLVDTIKRMDGDIVGETLDRRTLGAAQTPQGVRAALLRTALARFPPGEGPTYTDEAALLEACSIPVHAIPGEPTNRKVTVPADLQQIDASFAGGRGMRTALGQDQHPFGPGEPLALGGLVFAGAPRLHGHSDGDVALHAVADALLGAARLGDLGRLFPADATTPSGIASERLLDEVVNRLRGAGLRAASVDLTISGARPRLASRLDEMQGRIAGILGMPIGAVSVKATTGNLDGMEGAGRGMSAQAIVIVEAA
jgi:2-C-methyl-D-erythritol 4-phosphate cytidylyltransferase/2-C-methyl-D-erythritol 2,4-cyclodiphosphate synthase